MIYMSLLYLVNHSVGIYICYICMYMCVYVENVFMYYKQQYNKNQLIVDSCHAWKVNCHYFKKKSIEEKIEKERKRNNKNNYQIKIKQK